MNAGNNNKKLRESFEQAANIYQQARPDYPEELRNTNYGICTDKQEPFIL
ncbi:hypothetical protein [Paenibacillus nasutitermitis]|uniref:Uncharacterized protein n=1 Tax=Paenibacillus nasutitermitis TaxID=1652958 RepID=A0A917DQ46_9BACL|nr:hypothetical protein [Paenibacillus nasutitermitis]GGD55725.1 hypothetical protein GCM10010911_11780 [Paenibacillus nasutitermitis]